MTNSAADLMGSEPDEDSAARLVGAERRRTAVAPVQPGTLLWRYLGDWRYMLTSSRWGALQVMDPAFGAASFQHSAIFTEPLDRLMRSMPPIYGVVYDGAEAAATTRWVLQQHIGVKGTDHNGNRYHALNPDTFYWAHATFVDCLVAMIDRFDHRMDHIEKEQLYQESRQWWAQYGIAKKNEPATWDEFCVYFDDFAAQVLEKTKGFDRAMEIARDPRPAPQTQMPQWLYWIFAPVLTRFGSFLMYGLLPESVRMTVGYTWSPWQERAFSMVAASIRITWPWLPRRIKYVQRARAAFDRDNAWPTRFKTNGHPAH
ncbi:oxygenase MpaB family protein [Nocardia sp. NBC_01503]|uniref:oxygenase MpaB family protein n=1 Tax=Nocardia sp. NBC_01503 TaxID=2975997 RepID=UPI002E7AD18B|nr:oxygenase MpaB family protein [Nocardia sp. NBC_01503]WTL32151.1 oxygenase MpaB family protein [Nocardia sp. NBC_01503]